MSGIDIRIFGYGSDNYGFLVHDGASGNTALVDAGDASAASRALSDAGWTLTQIWITHHHGDHVAGLAELKSATGATVYGPEQRSRPIGGLDRQLWDGDTLEFAGRTVRIIATPGHTTDMINYHIADDGVVFTGDTLFTLGCGRLFEGDADTMWNSLSKLMALPADTKVYGAHEYTLANAAFALSVDGNNQALNARIEQFKAMRERGEPTVPSTIGEELATNPFLRARDGDMKAAMGLDGLTDAEVFAEIRKRKDRF